MRCNWLGLVVSARSTDLNIYQSSNDNTYLFYENITSSLVSTLLKAALNNDSMFLSGILMSTTTVELEIGVSRLVGWLALNLVVLEFDVCAEIFLLLLP